MFLPRRAGTEGIVPGGGRNDRFPGFDVLAEVEHWDAATAGVVLARIGPPPPIRFFTPAEEAVGRALFDQLLDQRADPRIPVLNLVDARLAEDITDGWRYDDMPTDEDAFRLTFAALDGDARELLGRRFADCSWDEQADLVQRVQDLNEDGADWHRLPAQQVWSLWTRYACAAFYSHPWAWNEIGFGGPAYPRGYKNVGVGKREPFEVEDALDRDPVRVVERLESERRQRARADGVE